MAQKIEFAAPYGKLDQYQKIREITAGHLSFGLGQSPQSFPMFEIDLFSPLRNSTLKEIVITNTMCLGPLIQIRLQIEFLAPL